MCRLAWQLLGMLGNVLGMLRNVLGILGMLFRKVLGVPHRRKTPPSCYLISCKAKGIVYHQVSYMEAWWYTTPLASQLIRQQVGGGFLRCGTPRTLRKGMPRTPRMLPSMPRSCQVSLHILGSHIKSLVVHYSLSFTAYKAASGGIFLRCGTPRTLRKGMPRTPRTLPSMPRTLPSMPRTAENIAKQAYTS